MVAVETRRNLRTQNLQLPVEQEQPQEEPQAVNPNALPPAGSPAFNPTVAGAADALTRFNVESGADQRRLSLQSQPIGKTYDAKTEEFLKGLEQSPTAQDDIEFLRNQGVDIELTNGGGSRFDKTQGEHGTIVVDTSQPNAAGDLANEAYHARQHLSGTSTINTESARTLSRDEYVSKAVAEEADSEVHQRTVERELAGEPPLTDAEKEQIKSDYASGKARADVPGQPSYSDYHGASWDRVKSDPTAEASPPAAPWDFLKDLVGNALDFGKGVVEGLKQQGLDLWNDVKKLGGIAGDFAKAVLRGDLEGAIAPFKQAFNEAWEEIKSLGDNAVKAFENIKNTILNGPAYDKGVLLGGIIGVGAKGGGGGAASAARGIVGFIKRQAGIGDDDHHDESGRQTSEVTRNHQTLEQARNQALNEVGDLGHDKVPTHAKDFSDVPGQIQGFQSADGKRGFRIDWDPDKGIHYNWYDWTGGKKGEGGRWGAETWPGTKEDYLRLIADLNNR